MKYLLACMFLALALVGMAIFSKTGDAFAAIGSSGFSVASIAVCIKIMKGKNRQ